MRLLPHDFASLPRIAAFVKRTWAANCRHRLLWVLRGSLKATAEAVSHESLAFTFWTKDVRIRYSEIFQLRSLRLLQD